jgi:hypothetical protein
METDGIEIKENDQASQGGLIAQEQSFETIEETIQEVNVLAIQHFTIIPDYVDPTDSKYPFVVKTSSSVICIDGWNLVEKAKANGKTTVTCKVEYIAEHSDEELAIRKVAIRVRPKGGIASYAETIRNTKYLEKVLLASDKDLMSFGHGGTRKGESFINNRQDNVVEVLSSRLGKSVSTINQFLNDARFLDEKTLNFFADEKVGKKFFVEAHANKRVQLDRLKSKRICAPDITIQISKDMRKWHEEYRRTGKITSILDTQETEAETENEPPELEAPEETPPRAAKQEVLYPSYGNPSGDQEDSFENIKREFEPSARRLLEAFAITDPDEFGKRITVEVRCLCRIPQRLSAIRNTGIRMDSDQEVVLQ